ncbi:hypothetical protein C1646_774511 [Rhizophagus diaphanus]|nr:hypothetical protein C1646_774511 [Rhizophagus diaphanus] [Rhizophagus sp. MUCL 43196]
MARTDEQHIASVIFYIFLKLISNDEDIICLKIKNKQIIIYSYKLKIPFVPLDINNVDQLCKLMKKHTVLFFLLFPLLFSLISKLQSNELQNLIKENWFNKYGEIWVTNLEKMISSENFLFIDEIVKNCKNCLISEEESWYFDNEVKTNEEINKTYNDHLNILLFSNSYMDTIYKLFNEVILNFNSKSVSKLSKES